MLISISHVTCLVVLSSVLLAITQYIDGYHKDEMKRVQDKSAGMKVPEAENKSPSLDRLWAKQDNITALEVKHLTKEVYLIYVFLTLLSLYALAHPILCHFKIIIPIIYFILSGVLVCLYCWIGYRVYKLGNDRLQLHKDNDDFAIQFESTMQTWEDAQSNLDCAFNGDAKPN